MRLRFLEGTLFRVVSGQDAAFASCDLGIFDELRRFLAGSGMPVSLCQRLPDGPGPMGNFRWCLPCPVPFGTLPARKRGAALGGRAAHHEEEPEDLIRRQLLHILPGHRESALRASRAAVGRPQRRAGLATGQQADEGY